MKILVCIKQVPDTVEVKIDPKTGTLIRDGVPSIINHDDKTGIEAALRIKEQLGGTVTVVVGAILKSYLKDLFLDIRVHGILLSS